VKQEHLGDVYEQQGKTELARSAWNKALSLAVEVESIARLKSKLSAETKD
jgi:predicted negative regulator of RcsB-dependent stress response